MALLIIMMESDGPILVLYSSWYIMLIAIIEYSIPPVNHVERRRQHYLTNSKTGNDSAELGRKKYINNYIIFIALLI